MNRERKSRVWDIYKKVFIPIETYGLITSDFGAFGIMLKDWENYKEGEYMYQNAQTQSEWTGLKDKNGTDIYEGDLTEIKGNICEVKFGTFFICGWEFNIVNKPGCYPFSTTCTNFNNTGCKDIEIIGNIYQHPELLTKQS